MGFPLTFGISCCFGIPVSQKKAQGGCGFGLGMQSRHQQLTFPQARPIFSAARFPCAENADFTLLQGSAFQRLPDTHSVKNFRKPQRRALCSEELFHTNGISDSHSLLRQVVYRLRAFEKSLQNSEVPPSTEIFSRIPRENPLIRHSLPGVTPLQNLYFWP